MFGQQYKLKELFEKHGWELVETWIPEEFWVAEIWILKSAWSTTECFAAMNYVVDPQWIDKNNKQLGVPSVAVSLTQSHYLKYELQIEADAKFEFHSDAFIEIYIRPNLEKNIPKIFEELANLRQKFNNLANQ
jgi:hypothetical protein